MNILIVGADSALARNFAENLYLIRDGKLRSFAAVEIESVLEYVRTDAAEDLRKYCNKADRVFDFSAEKCGVGSDLWAVLTKTLQEENADCPIFRLCRNEDGDICEQQLVQYNAQTAVNVFLYRVPEVFGKWDDRADENTVSAFCKMAANSLELPEISRGEKRELLYVDDLVEVLLNTLRDEVQSLGANVVYNLSGTYSMTMGLVYDLLETFKRQQKTQEMPEIPVESFAYRLFSTYLSYLPKEKICFSLDRRVTDGGEQFRVMTTRSTGQITINRYRPGTTLGLHWHNSKWEQYMVISGHGLVRERKVGDNEVIEFEVTGELPKAVQMLPGYVHSITNLSKTEDLVILIWASEMFNPKHPDTNTADI